MELVDSMSRKSSKQPSPDGKDDGQKYQALGSTVLGENGSIERQQGLDHDRSSAGSGGGGHDAVDSTINPYQKKNGKDGKAGDQRRTDTLAGLSPDEMAKLSLPIPPSGSPAMIGITPSHSITTAGGGSSFAALKGGALPVSSAVESKNRTGGDSGDMEVYKKALRDSAASPSASRPSTEASDSSSMQQQQQQQRRPGNPSVLFIPHSFTAYGRTGNYATIIVDHFSPSVQF